MLTHIAIGLGAWCALSAAVAPFVGAYLKGLS